MKPFVSVILTVYNTAKYLRQCLDSLVKQSLKNIEIICVDDASSDESVKILKEYQAHDSRIKIIEFTANKGANFARNTALKKTQGSYIAILDADDFYELNFLEELYVKAQKNKADITFCGFNVFDNTTKKVVNVNWDIKRNILPQSEVFIMEPQLFDLLPSFVWNQLYRRKFVQENNLIFADIKCYTDVYFNKTALLKAKRISCVDKKLIYYRMNNLESISHNLTYSGAIRTIYALAAFLEKENLMQKYKQAFFETSLLKMNRSENIPEPYRSLLRSFYLKKLIPKFWDNVTVPDEFLYLNVIDNCSDDFKRFFLRRRDKIVPMVMCANNRTIPEVAVTIQSVIENSQDDYFYDFYILGSDLSSESCFDLVLLTAKNLRVSCMNVPANYISEIQSNQDFSHIPELIEGYDKILYLEAKTLVDEHLIKVFTKNAKSDFPVGKILLTEKNENNPHHKISKILPIGRATSDDSRWWKIARRSILYELLLDDIL